MLGASISACFWGVKPSCTFSCDAASATAWIAMEDSMGTQSLILVLRNATQSTQCSQVCELINCLLWTWLHKPHSGQYGTINRGFQSHQTNKQQNVNASRLLAYTCVCSLSASQYVDMVSVLDAQPHRVPLQRRTGKESCLAPLGSFARLQRYKVPVHLGGLYL